MTSRHDEAVNLSKAGVSYAEIGRRLGTSRERARRIVKGNPTRPRKPVLEPKVMLTIGDVARFLNLHISTVRRWSNRGILKSYRIGLRGDRRFRREDVEGLLLLQGSRTSNQGEMVMILRTRIFDLYHEKYTDLSELARAMGIHPSQIYRVKLGMRPVGEKFIIGAVKAFPDKNLDELFYVRRTE